MSDRVEIEDGWCDNCGQFIQRVPFQPDPAKRTTWVWQWIHQGTGRTGCDKVLYAEPRADHVLGVRLADARSANRSEMDK